jgi:hypothetical protein
LVKVLRNKFNNSHITQKNKTKVFVYVGGDIANIINGNLMLSHYQLLSVIDSTNFINFATMYFGDVISLSDVLGIRLTLITKMSLIPQKLS